ncbi:MAG: chemotaxis protein CheB [Pseudomonadota bacterium]
MEDAAKPDPRVSDSAMVGIVGIGASAGGLEAVSDLVGHIPENSGLCFVIVQHLAPDHPSIMDQLLSGHTPLPVCKIVDGMAAKPDAVFVIPPGTSLTISGGVFNLEARDSSRGLRTPIDKFLTSLAEDCGEGAACVILSGTGSDGTIGLRAIKSHGGIAMVQDSASARFTGMPDSASATGVVDFVLEPAKIARRLYEVMRHRQDLKDRKIGGDLQARISEKLPEIVALLADEDGHDFGAYKEGTLLRRVERRMVILRLNTVDEMIEALKNSEQERLRLLQDFLIGVTQFFRDAEVFEELAADVIPEIVDTTQSELRVWVPGCSTGEEAYSLAILFLEDMRRRGDKRRLQVFGTDVDLGALRHARAGRYAPSTLAGVDPALIERYFEADEADYMVKPVLRETVIFAPHNVMSDPPFSKIDMVSCRNVLIYLTKEGQETVLARFHYALRGAGVLLLGTSETIGDHSAFFAPLSRQNRIFRRDNARSMGYTAVGANMTAPRTPRSIDGASLVPAVSRPDLSERPLDVVADQFFLSRFSPPYLVVGERDHVLYLSSNAGPFISPTKGQVSSEIDGLLARALRAPVQKVLQRVRNGDGPASERDVIVELDGDQRIVDIQADRLPGQGDQILIAFQPVRLETGVDLAAHTRATEDDVAGELQRELELTRRNLGAAQADYEASEQELRSANEELLSMNEELQSSNEELETSREELQSINEELETINAELSENNRLLATANGDLRNVMESTDIPTVILGDGLEVRRFTRAARNLFSMDDRDIGRPITDLAWKIAYPEMAEDVASVKDTLQMVEREVVDPASGTTFQTRVRPYRGVDDRLDGCVITFVDVTERLRAARALEHSEKRLSAALKAGSLGVYELRLSDRSFTWDNTCRELYGFGRLEPLTIEDTFAPVHPDDIDVLHKSAEAAFDPDGDGHFEARYRICHRKTGEVRWIRSEGEVLRDDGDDRLIGTMSDITEELAAQQALRDSQARLDAALRAGNIGVFDYDPVAGTVLWDARSGEIWGVDTNAPIDADVAFAGIHSDDLDRVNETLANAFDPAGPGRFEAQYRVTNARTGDVVWVRAEGDVEFHNGQPVKLIGTNKDVTEDRRIAQEIRDTAARLALTYEVTGIAAFQWDVATNKSTWTPNMYTLLGCPPEREASFALFEEFIHPDDRARVQKAVEHAMAEGALFDQDFRVIRGSDGAERILAGKGRAIYDDDGKPVAMIGINFDQTDAVRQEAHRELLTNELNHRVKNSLATIQSIAKQTLRNTDDMDVFRDKFLGRLQAIARAHDILVNDDISDTMIADLVRAQVGPYAGNDKKRLVTSGPPITLGASVAHSLGLILHELATNAAKYGALVNEHGRILIDWSEIRIDGTPGLKIVWRESGGPPVTPPKTKGFGSRLIESSLALSLGGHSSLRFEREGFVAEIACHRRAEDEQ